MSGPISFPPPNTPTIEVSTDPIETRTHALRYLTIALVIGGLAAGIFFVCPIAAFALWGLSGWFVWSASIVTLNYLAANSCLAAPIHRIHALIYDINCIFYTLPLLPITLFERCHQPTRTQSFEETSIPILMLNGYLSYGTTFERCHQPTRTQSFEETAIPTLQSQSFEETAIPILMLNGYLGYGTTLRPLGNALHQGPVHTMNIHTGKTIEANAARVAKKINRICAKHQCNRVVLIGHSMGGLIAQYSATHPEGHPQIRVTKVIAIGSPIEGTPIARAGLTPDARQMRPNAPFIAELKANREANPHKTRFYYIGSESDTVVPLSSAMGVDASPQFKVLDKGHLGMIYDGRIARQINEWLEEEIDHLSSEETAGQLPIDNPPSESVEYAEEVVKPGVVRRLVF